MLYHHFCRISTSRVFSFQGREGAPTPPSVSVLFYFTDELLPLKPSRSASTMCQAHQSGSEPTNPLFNSKEKKIGCESHACLFLLLYTYVLYINIYINIEYCRYL